ncbi:hypothetical protein Ljor_0498 [Legionella jordanis]|uniref:Uncharacterized protein n=1 Tax=Legionella jordanis TaxID=456 RepID=A0A0W0V7U6_9GAMM|nr:hypothetical protein Ljor_0498 [Legionella jordanis]VEH12350.1 Uncharacterised protein [Legionella jordanis]
MINPYICLGALGHPYELWLDLKILKDKKSPILSRFSLCHSLMYQVGTLNSGHKVPFPSEFFLLWPKC